MAYPISVQQTLDRLQKMQFFHTALMQVGSSLMVHVANLEQKLALGLGVYWDSQCVQLLQKRQFELRGNQTAMLRPSVEIDQLLLNLVQEEREAILPALAAFRKYQLRELAEHKTLTHRLWDELTFELIDQLERLIRKHYDLLHDLLTYDDTKAVEAFEARIANALSVQSPEAVEFPLPYVAPLKEIPARDSRFTVVNVEDVKRPEEPELQLRFNYHNVAFAVELAAVEICSRLIVDHPEMPQAFGFDFAKQLYDECIHTKSLIAFIQQEGGQIGEFPIHYNLWNYFLLGEGVKERITIQQIVNEGHALDFNLSSVKLHKFRKETFHSILNDYVGADELNHVRYGVKWLTYLTGSEEASLKVIDEIYMRLKQRNFLPRFPVHIAERKIAWMSDEMIDRAKQAVDESLLKLKQLQENAK